jgi:hypothetical protein
LQGVVCLREALVEHQRADDAENDNFGQEPASKSLPCVGNGLLPLPLGGIKAPEPFGKSPIHGGQVMDVDDTVENKKYNVDPEENLQEFCGSDVNVAEN